MPDRAKAIYFNAKRYSKASYSLNTASSQDIDLLLPSMVNAALALELYFKTLFYLENGNDFKIAGKHSHNFSRLFDRLKICTQKELEQSFDDLIKNRRLLDVEAIEQASSVVIPRDLNGSLKAWSNVFVQVRYIYDSSGQILPMMFFPEIEESVLLVIYKFKPEWKKGVGSINS